MDIERYFVSALLGGRDIQAVIDARISPDYLRDDSHRRVFELILDHYRLYGEVPLISTVKKNFPTYRVIKVDHGIGYYCDEVRRAHLHEELLISLGDMQGYLTDKDPEAALAVLQQTIGGLSLISTVMVDENLVKTWDDRITEYEEVRENGGRLRGYPTGFPSIDIATGGLQGSQFNLIVGLPKSGKSTTLLVFGKNAHANGAKILLVNFEMTNMEQGSRYDSVVAQIDHQRLISGQITKQDIKRLEEVGKEREGMRGFISSTDLASVTTVSGIAAKIDQHRPSVVLIDGVYLMDDEEGERKGSSQAITNVTRGLARLAKQKDVNITGTTQVLESKVSSARGITPGSVGYASSFQQDCHVMIAVEAIEDMDDVQRLRVLLSRSGPKTQAHVRWDWSTGTFEEIEADEDPE